MKEEWSEDDAKWAKEMLTCRQIVGEINKFGINERQKIKIIELLAIELEDHTTAVAIANLTKGTLEKIETGAPKQPTGRILV